MFNQFYLKRTIEKEAIHDDDLELYAIQKARELNWDTFKTSKSFINDFLKAKTEYHQEDITKSLLERNQIEKYAV
ncbi:unnamed protein product [Rotaria sordida]|uniref:Uncharacterized protein n=1 Tax=Rotaria sordida TaxID=392033 RepID=A0A819LPQ1_9BILA|nr:unnamed protein product [Rotaria sordida]CAF3965033.1 unnamed protein product [Rotaria sordida]